MAESEGFEPSKERLAPYSLSRRAPSTDSANSPRSSAPVLARRGDHYTHGVTTEKRGDPVGVYHGHIVSRGGGLKTDVRISPGVTKRLKRVVAGTVFWVMGRGLVTCARIDSRVRVEADAWPEGTTITLAIAPGSPRVTIRKQDGVLRALGLGADQDSTLLVTFKSVDGAVPVLLGMKSVLQSFAEHRATVRGDLAIAMSLVRCLHIVEGYLFPDVMTRRILPRPATRERGHLRAYVGLLGKKAVLNQEGAVL